MTGEEDTALLFYDLSLMSQRIDRIRELFPSDSLHTVAVKANPLTAVLTRIRDLGIGLEVASLPELYLAEKAGFTPGAVVFDSPVKTTAELVYALDLGVHVNADSLQELARLDNLLRKQPSGSKRPSGLTIGVRINPQVGTGAIPSTSVAGEYSKFGVPLKDHHDDLVESFLNYPWLTGVHLHVGSQGCPLELLVNGVETVARFVGEVNAILARRGADRKIDIFDIGGGLPVSYHGDKDKHPGQMEQYRDALRQRVPELFSGEFKLITEFGRYVHANAGWTASQVEYVKHGSGKNTAMVHVGADLLLRTCYLPGQWPHEITVRDRLGNLKTGREAKTYTIAGPLCFAGDIIARDIALPEIEPGDYLVVRDTGAYTVSMWSRYNSRQIPKIIGYYGDGEVFEVLRARERLQDIWDFWSGPSTK